MANGSNRTDSGLDFFRQSEQEGSGIDFFRSDEPSARTVAPETPDQQPVDRQPEVGFLEALRASFAASPLLPDIGRGGPTAGETIGAVPGAAEQVAERATELPLSTARGALAVPAGVERLLRAGIEAAGADIPDIIEVGNVPISTKPFEDLVAQTEYSQEILRNWFGNDESQFVNIMGEIAGGYVTADQLFKIPGFVNKFVASRLSPALFRPLVSESAEAAALSKAPAAVRSAVLEFAESGARAGVAAADGALFMAGLPDTDQTDILLGLGLGLGLQGGVEIAGGFLRAKTARAFPDKIDEIRRIAREGDDISIEGFPEFLARVDSNLQLGAPYGQTSDEAIASIRATLSESGETGAIGAVRGLTDLTDESLANLRQAFPRYRFEVITRAGGDAVSDQKLLFGLAPGQKLPEGTRSAPSLTDKVIDDFRRTGLLRDQKVLVDGVEHRFLSALDEGDRVLVKPQHGEPIAVGRERVARLDETSGLLQNERLLEQFRSFRGSQQIDDIDRAADEFIERFAEDLDPALVPHLKRYFREQEARFLANRLRPDEASTLQRFRSARKRLLEEGVSETESLGVLAASRGHVIHNMSGGRVKTTNLVTGETKGPFRSPDEASAYLRDLETFVPDVTPSIPGVPDELLEGMAVSAPQPNPSIPSGEDLINGGIMDAFRRAPEAFKNFWTNHFGRWATQMEPAARRIEQSTGHAIWSDGMLPVQNDLAIVKNRSAQFMDRLNGIFRSVDEADQDLIEGWLRSEAKETFERSHEMPQRLINKAEEIRLWYEDFFNEMSTATGTTLSADDWLRNYAPDMMDYTAQTGRNDYVELFRNTTDDVPNEVRFFSEMFKSGEMALTPQAPLYAKAARALRSGMFKAHAGRSFENAVAFAKTLPDGSVAKRHLIDYLTGVRGPTDMVRQRLNRAFGDLYEELGIKLSTSDRRNLVDAGMDATYGALIGWRPAMIMRNVTQPQNLAGPFLGHRRVAKSQLRALEPELQAEARRLGITQKRPAVSFGETLEEGTGFLNRLGKKGLQGYTAVDEWNRVALWDAVRRKARGPLQRFRQGEINATEFFEESGLWIMDTPQRQAFMEILEGGRPDVIGGENTLERALNFAGNEVGSKLTNFMYGAKNQPRWTRGTVGRVFGSYGTWPMGYLNYLAQIGAAEVRRGVKLKTLAKHGAFNIGVANAGKTIGVGLGSWVAWNSITFSGGPLREFLFSDLPNLWGGMPWQRAEAWNRVRNQAPRLFLPGGQLLFSDIPTAIERLESGQPGAAVAEAAGFRTFDRGETPGPGIPTPFGQVPPARQDAASVRLP